jgi:hypothetical protein
MKIGIPSRLIMGVNVDSGIRVYRAMIEERGAILVDTPGLEPSGILSGTPGANYRVIGHHCLRRVSVVVRVRRRGMKNQKHARERVFIEPKVADFSRHAMSRNWEQNQSATAETN